MIEATSGDCRSARRHDIPTQDQGEASGNRVLNPRLQLAEVGNCLLQAVYMCFIVD
jgi:hypothetical protein